jgi:hypothetical protein
MRYAVPHRLAWVFDDGDGSRPVRLVLMHLPNGDPVMLEGASALIWILAVGGEEDEAYDVASALAKLISRPLNEIAEETEKFLFDLRAGQLLIEKDPS